MSRDKSGIDRFAASWAQVVLRFRWLVILAAIVIVAAAGSGGKYLAFATDYRIFFDDSNPELQAFEAFQQNYTKNDNIFFVIQPKDGDVFTPEMAGLIETLTEKAWQIPYTIRVDSIANFQYSRAEEDDLIVEDLIDEGSQLSSQQLQAIRDIALSEPLLKDSLVSSDGKTVGINVTVQFPRQSIAESPMAVAYARQIAAETEAAYPGIKIALSGFGMLSNAFAEAGMIDMGTLVPTMYLVLVVMAMLVLRSVIASLVTLVVIAASTIFAMGITGYVGVELVPISVSSSTIILTLAIADSVHILVSIFAAQRAGRSKYEAIRDGITINFVAVSVTSLTTGVGFLALNFSDSPPFWHLGNITALGIFAAWLFSLTLLPALLSLLPLKAPKKKEAGIVEQSLIKLADWVIIHYKKVFVVMGLISVGLGSLAVTVELNDEYVKYFDESIQFRTDADFATEHLSGPYVLEYSIPAAEPNGISHPEYLQQLDRFTHWLRQQPQVTHVYSYTDIVKRLNKNMHADDPSWYKLPDDQALAAQYLLLYELSLPYGLDLNNRITIDKSATRVSVTVGDLSTVDLRKFIAITDQWMLDNWPAHMHASATGAAQMFAYISERNINSMITGNAMALACIAAIMLMVLRSVGLGAISLVANTIPIMITFGIWSLLVGQIGIAAAAICATSLGIVVDDTVHFLTKYRYARIHNGLNCAGAIRYAMSTVGMAILSTTVIVTIGFAILATSPFMVNNQMGLLTAITIVVALIFDFMFLPALLMLTDRDKAKQARHASLADQPENNLQLVND